MARKRQPEPQPQPTIKPRRIRVKMTVVNPSGMPVPVARAVKTVIKNATLKVPFMPPMPPMPTGRGGRATYDL